MCEYTLGSGWSQTARTMCFPTDLDSRFFFVEILDTYLIFESFTSLRNLRNVKWICCTEKIGNSLWGIGAGIGDDGELNDHTACISFQSDLHNKMTACWS